MRASPYAGRWYPGDSVELRDLLDRLFDQSKQRTGDGLPGGASAFVVPHAGLMYSGTVAAAVYRSARARGGRRIVILGFSHSQAHAGVCIPDVAAYRTPLGDVAVDRETSADLCRRSAFRSTPGDALYDHSVEIQLPLIQRALPEARVVPLYAGRLDAVERAQVIEALRNLMREGVLVVASSDLTHYGRGFDYQPFPVDDRTQEKLRELDTEVIDAASSLDRGMFDEALRRTGATVCGQGPIGLLLDTFSEAAGEEIFQATLDYQTSGDITGDWGHCVSYGALGYFPQHAFGLETADQRALLGSARRTLDEFARAGRRSPVPAGGGAFALDRKAGVFVTLYQRGDLRGCVGRREAGAPLSQAVAELVLSAALDDPRFTPVSRGDSVIDLKISVLTPMKRVVGAGRIDLERDGVYMEAGEHRALLLPGVARDMNWSREQFLAGLARKAGASPDAWKHASTRFWIFRAQTFEDRALPAIQ